MKRFLPILSTLILTLSGCLNTPTSSKTGPSSTPSTLPNTGTDRNTNGNSQMGSTTLTMSNITVSTPSSANQPVISAFFPANNPTLAISNFCQVGGTRACRCQFRWQEVNSTSSQEVRIPRSVQTEVASIQPSLLTCNAPQAYLTEILDGTIVTLTILPTGSNPGGFTVTPRTFTKNSSTQGGSGTFQDAAGYSYDDILRYVCHDKVIKGTAIQSKTFQKQDNTANSQGDTEFVISSNQFCVRKSSGGGASQGGCEGLPPTEGSAQSYYYNFYIRNSAKGSINLENLRYRCPLVQEALAASTSNGTQADYFPLDSSYSLSTTPQNQFTVGVEAYTKIGVNNDPSSQNSGCSANQSGGGVGGGTTTSSRVRGCLGFAARPNQDGTCPTFQRANGQTVQTYRLRRYIALYPPHFESNGEIRAENQQSDTIYVLDRPVRSPSGKESVVMTMLGPKPCPFSYFDRKAVTQSISNAQYSPTGGYVPTYAATGFSGWNGVNVDGTELPNIDRLVSDGSTSGNASCAATLPILNRTSNTWSLATVHNSNPVLKRVFIRPMRAWSPHYVEDLDFRACAPPPSILRDPPLHFAKNPVTGNVAYCAAAYPTQNPNLRDLEPSSGSVDLLTSATGGKVRPYTSSVVKNSISPPCSPTIPSIPSGYAADGQARHLASLASHQVDVVPLLASDTAHCAQKGGTLSGTTCTFHGSRTCDRTLLSTNPQPSPPLLARAPQIEAALQNDSSYECRVSYDGGGSKEGKRTPSQGCCGAAVRVWTGIGNSSPQLFNMSAHLEPDTGTGATLCQIPNY